MKTRLTEGPGPGPGLVPDGASTRAPTADPGVAREHAWLVAVLPPPPARLLDAGCGNGAVTAWLTGLGYQVTAIDADPAAVARARAAGVPAVHASLADFIDRPFDAVLMLLTLHHMHPLPAVLDQVARLLRPGGLLILDEFAWDWADPATVRWFDDIASILAVVGVSDPAAGPLSPVGLPATASRAGDLGAAAQANRWRARHTEHGTACNTGEVMIREVSARFSEIELRPVPYLARHLISRRAHPDAFTAVSRIERDHIADGTLAAIGFRAVAWQASA